MVFANPVKLRWCITGSVGPLGSTNQNWWDARLLQMSILIYPVDCVHLCHLLRTQHHCLCPNGRENPPLACPYPAPSHPSLIHNTCDITGVVKNYLKNQHSEYCMAELAIKHQLHITLFYLYSKFGMATMYHDKTTIDSIFQNGIS